MSRTTILCCVWLALMGSSRGAEPIPHDQLEFFEARIRPVLVEQCYSCHNSAKQADGELKLDSREGLLKGGEHGAIVVPGKSNESRLLAILRHEVPGVRMPQGGGKLSDTVIADFEKWIAIGAPDPRDTPPTVEDLIKLTSWEAIVAKRKQWWSLQPVRDVLPPNVEGKPWSDHPIDRFILTKLREEQLEPGERADPRVLVRRVYFALIGLPPTSDEAEQWAERIGQPRGFENLVDHLLASPHFGERWARHWMDWIRYCDSHGSEGDPTIENGWLYRDYLIRALNSDVPYDQLVLEHIAGDLLAQPRINESLGINESLIGTAHWRMVFHGFSPTDALDEKVRFVDDQVNAFSKAFMGLTISCARCHNHKFDAISQQDYYALFGILGSCRPGRSVIDVPEKQATNCEKLAVLKPQIREKLANAWLDDIKSLRERLLSPEGTAQTPDDPKQVLSAWSLLRKELSSGKPFNEAWQQRVTRWNQDRALRQQHAQRDTLMRWSMRDAKDLSTWTRTGSGLADGQPSAAGEFAIAPDGESLLTGIYPAGVYSHRFSQKHPARLTSHDANINGEYNVFMRVIGEGSSGRYVVYDYPRSGVVFPIAQFANEWQWVRLDMSYWDNDVVHLELTTAADAPLQARNDARSWFGAREIMIVKKSDPAPAESQEFLDSWFELATKDEPKSIEDAADRFVAALTNAINEWAKQTIDDSQALLLDSCLKQGVLPNQLAAFQAANNACDAKPATTQRTTTVCDLIAEYRRLEAEIPSFTRLPCLEETTDRTQPLYMRGNHKQPGELVSRGFLNVLNPQPYATSQSGRLQLAQDLLNANNPLTRRVIVNRLWHHLFGRGIVGTPDNFGRLGQLPTHPELLDHLATVFAQQGGSLKQAIRYMVTSQVWQLTSTPSPQAALRDPDNNWHSHAFVNRLEAEAIRDSLLAVSGQLNREQFGPPVDGGSPRRSVYMRVQRNSLDPFLRAFDFPEPFTAVGRRDVTNVPAQSLTLMNDSRVASLATAWSAQLLADRSMSDEVRIQKIFLTAFGRPARAIEVQKFRAYLVESAARHAEMRKQSAQFKKQIDERQAAIRKIVEPVRAKLLTETNERTLILKSAAPRPINRWDFQEHLKDLTGTAHAELQNGAKLDSGGLSTAGKGFAVTLPLDRPLKAKTLEAWVQLDSLDQRGGGVITIQSRDGDQFDSIVFGEQSPRQWMAGSNGFARTQSFNGPVETEAVTRPVHVAIAYHPDGTIIGYRNGHPYGQPYKSNGPIEFKAGETTICFGLRHLPTGGNRHLAGRILRANLYERALTADEIVATSLSSPIFVSETEILALLSESDRQRVAADQQHISELQKALDALDPIPAPDERQAEWTELTRALLTFKEFLFVK